MDADALFFEPQFLHFKRNILVPASLCGACGYRVKEYSGVFGDIGRAEPAVVENRIQLPQLDILAKRSCRPTS